MGYFSNMETVETLYSYFLATLKGYVEENGRGTSKALAMDADISTQMLSQVLNQKKKAGLGTQKKLAEACGYEYKEFLAIGRMIVTGEDPGSLKKSSDTSLTKEVPSKEVKVGKKMEVEELRELLHHYKEELSELRDEIRYLRGELKEGRQEAEARKDEASTPEKKSAM